MLIQNRLVSVIASIMVAALSVSPVVATEKMSLRPVKAEEIMACLQKPLHVGEQTILFGDLGSTHYRFGYNNAFILKNGAKRFSHYDIADGVIHASVPGTGESADIVVTARNRTVYLDGVATDCRQG